MTLPLGPTAEAPDEVKSSGGRDLMHDRRALLLVVGAVVALAALAFFVVLPALKGSSSTPTNAALPLHRVNGIATPTVHPTAAAPAAVVSPTVKPAAAVQVLSTADPVIRDPFSPLYTEPPVATSSPAASTSPSVTPSATATAPQMATVDLAQINSPKEVTVTVNSAVYLVKQGVSFAGNFMLLGVQGNTATFDYGDQPFTLTVGEQETF